MNRNCLEQDLLKELLNYDPETGVFIRLHSAGNKKAGSIADTSDKSYGYSNININKSTYKAHRLAWIYMYGDIPKGTQIDHINGVKNDNRIANLRLATMSEQQQNAKIRTDNMSGSPNVTWHKLNKKWRVQIMVNGKRVSKGLYTDLFEAVEVSKQAKVEHHTFNPIQRGH